MLLSQFLDQILFFILSLEIYINSVRVFELLVSNRNVKVNKFTFQYHTIQLHCGLFI